MVTAPSDAPVIDVNWRGAVRIIRSAYPPIDLFEDVADPADWPLLISAEQKTNPRMMENLGNLDLVPPKRRVGGPGANWLMAPFTHVSTDRPSRFSDGKFGVLYAASAFETALIETIYHHGRFMARTREAAGWTSQFREIVMDISGALHYVRGIAAVHSPVDYTDSQTLGQALRSSGSNGVVYRSVRHEGGECAGLFFPDLASNAAQGRHLDYHWDGARVDLVRDAGRGEVFRIV
jgi:hypothetical protein